MSAAPTDAVGLIAGAGTFPLDLARSARVGGRVVVALAFHRETDPRIEAEASSVTWLHPGEVGRALAALRGAGVRDVAMAGKVSKTALLADPAAVPVDAEGGCLLARAASRSDGALLRAVADVLASSGLHLLDQATLAPELVAPEGVLGARSPSAASLADVATAWPVAAALADLDVGQTVVVKDRAVLAVEAVEGTDAALERAGRFARGASALKVAGRHRDPRFDLPAVGPETVRVAAAAGIVTLAVEAGRSLLLDRERLVSLADRHGIALLGVVAPTGEAGT